MNEKNTPKPNIPEKFLKPYNPAETEGRIYKLWEESGLFAPNHLSQISADKKTRMRRCGYQQRKLIHIVDRGYLFANIITD
ncbi:MAG: hypothetical protein AAB891_00045 [Patescibacteria group bacterium]